MGGRGYLEQKYRWCKEQTNLSAAVPLEQYHDRYTQKRCCTRGFLSRKAALEKGQIEHSNRDTALKERLHRDALTTSQYLYFCFKVTVHQSSRHITGL